MLKPKTIPDIEPLLRVGIVLPEDKFDSITLELSSKEKYEIRNHSNFSETVKESKLTFSILNNSIQFNSGKSSKKWVIAPKHNINIAPKSGIKALNVVAGRGFHWQKYIDVFLPGAIEIAIANGNLILINELPIEQYLMCVATSEMSAECPEALIESQTIAARSWMLANIEQKHVSLGMDVCNDDCCQRYQGTTYLTNQSITGANNTFGQVLLHEDKICDARYSKSCGGAMETFTTIWSGKEIPYLKNKFDFLQENKSYSLPLNTDKKVKDWVNAQPDSFCSPTIVSEDTLPKYLGNVDKEGSYYRWKFDYTQLEITTLLNKQLKINAANILSIEALERGGSGRIVYLKVSYLDKNDKIQSYNIERDVEIRRVMHENFMYSSCITIDASEFKHDIPGLFTIKGAGWGHGVGLCQIGALGMALKGYSTEDILYHYFPESQLKKIY